MVVCVLKNGPAVVMLGLNIIEPAGTPQKVPLGGPSSFAWSRQLVNDKELRLEPVMTVAPIWLVKLTGGAVTGIVKSCAAMNKSRTCATLVRFATESFVVRTAPEGSPGEFDVDVRPVMFKGNEVSTHDVVVFAGLTPHTTIGPPSRA